MANHQAVAVKNRVLIFGLLVVLLAALLDSFSDSRVAVRDSSTTGASRIVLGELAAGWRYGPYSAIRQYAGASRILVEEDSLSRLGRYPEGTLAVELLLALGGVVEAAKADLSAYSLPGDSIVAEGTAWAGAWSLHLDDRLGSSITLLAKPVDGVLRIADARLVNGWPDEAPVAISERTRLPAAAGGLIDAALLVFLILAGGLLIPRVRFHRSVRVVLALPVGLAALGALGILRIPGAWGLVATLLAGLAGWWWLRRNGEAAGWSKDDWPALSLAAIGAVLVATWSRAHGFIWTSPDSIAYLAQGSLLADGRWTVDLVALKRGMAQQQLHAPSFAMGVEGFQSLGAAVLVAAAMLLLVATLPWGTTSSAVVPRHWIWIAGACAGLLFVAPALPIQAAYVNSHALLALLLLSLVVFLDHLSDEYPGSQAGAVPSAGLLLAAIVLLRPEGTLLAALVLLGTLRANLPAHPALWRWLGSATLSWNGILVYGHLQRGESPARIILVMIAVGVVLVVTPVAVRILPPRFVRSIPLLVGSVLWSTTLLLLLGNIGSVHFLDAAIVNIGEAQGRWGSFGLMLFLMGVLAVALPERPSDGAGLLGARWTLIGFIPLSLFSKLGDGLQSNTAGFETLLSGGGGIGWGDSVNRMWTHAICLVLLLVILRFAEWREASEEAGEAHRSAEVSGT